LKLTTILILIFSEPGGKLLNGKLLNSGHKIIKIGEESEINAAVWLFVIKAETLRVLPGVFIVPREFDPVITLPGYRRTKGRV
jgi:hypothetical protein